MISDLKAEASLRHSIAFGPSLPDSLKELDGGSVLYQYDGQGSRVMKVMEERSKSQGSKS